MENGLFQEQEAKKIFCQIVSAIKYCHNLNIVHQVLKLQNILRNTEVIVKLTDKAWPSSEAMDPY